jgi:hypothetical protein
MAYFDTVYLLGVVCGLVIITFGVRARCWLLVAGYVLQLPVDGQVLFAKIFRIAGIASSDPSQSTVYLNRTLGVSSLLLITLGIVQLLHPYSRMRAAQQQPQ